MNEIDALVALVDVEPLEVNLFRGTNVDRDMPRLYGGQVLGQALMAAGRTIEPERHVHSLHAYFLRLGDPKVPVVYEVDRIRDGASFATRRVVAIQHGRAIFNMAASFQVDEAGPEHQDAMPELADPETLPAFFPSEPEDEEPIDRQGGGHVLDFFDVRRGGKFRDPSLLDDTPRAPDMDTWIRTRGALPDDPLLHASIVAYASDFTLLGTTVMPHPLGEGHSGYMLASLDHVMWFHRPVCADEWLLFHTHSPSASAARGFATGQVFTREGLLVANLAQEGLLRPLRPQR